MSQNDFVTIDGPGAFRTGLQDINNNGQIVGMYQLPGGGPGVGTGIYRWFLYEGGKLTDFSLPGIPGAIPSAINNLGQIAGTYSVPSSAGAETVYGFIDTNGTVTRLEPAPNTTYIRIIQINDRGQVLGTYDARSAGGEHAFVYSNGTFTQIDIPGAATGSSAAEAASPAGEVSPAAINNRGQVTGEYVQATGDPAHPYKMVAFIDTGGKITKIDPPFATSTMPMAINDKGQVVANHFGSETAGAFIYDNGRIETISPPDALDVTVHDINNAGQVVGTYTDKFLTPEPAGSFGAHGFVYKDGTFTEITAPDGAPTFPLRINDVGQVIGTYPSATAGVVGHGFLASVPAAGTQPPAPGAVDWAALIAGLQSNDLIPLAPTLAQTVATTAEMLRQNFATFGRDMLNLTGSTGATAARYGGLPAAHL